MTNMKAPPKTAVRLLRMLSSRDRSEGYWGDIEEMFQDHFESRGYWGSFWWFWKEVLTSLPGFIGESIRWRSAMLKNYLKIAFRNLKRQKGYSFINVFGLAAGIGCCLLIVLYVRDELSYDRHFQNSKAIGRVVTVFDNDGVKMESALTPAPLARALKADYPEIAEAACFNTTGGGVLKYGDKAFEVKRIAFADPSFFRIFSFEFIYGNPETALSEPYSLVITEETAQTYFPGRNPLGESLDLSRGTLVVTGVVKRPVNSHLKFTHVVSTELYSKLGVNTEDWNRFNYTTYIQVRPEADLDAVGEKVAPYFTRVFDPESTTRLMVQPLRKIYLYSDFAYDIHIQTSDVKIVYMLSLIAVFILLIACVNFMNLATARSEKRTREVGLRKVVGARRCHLISQFLGESVFLASVSLILAAVVVEVVLPAFNALTSKEIRFLSAVDPFTLFGLLTLALITGIISGSYPAFFLSSFFPIQTVRGTLQRGRSGGMIRRILVTAQFAVSIILIIATAVIYQQLRYMQSKSLGYDKEQLVCLQMNREFRRAYSSFKAELLNSPEVVNVTATMNLPNWEWPSVMLSDWEGRDGDREIKICHGSVHYDFFETLGMEMVQGRGFSREFPADFKEALVINQEAVKQMGLEDPIGKHLSTWGHEGRVIGVVKDFHFDSIRNKISPLVLKLAPPETQYMIVRFKPGPVPNMIGLLEKNWKRFVPNYPFEYEFLDDVLSRNYRRERMLGKVVTIFSILGIFVACLGLFGLAAYIAERRTKEIGIRKILGSGVAGIVMLLTGSFIRWVLAAGVIAVPVAYYLANVLLKTYAYRTRLGLFLFLIPVLGAMIIAVVTVGFQSIKAALANPGDSLRYE